MSARRRRALGSLLFAASLAVMVMLAFLGGADKPPTRAASGLLVVIAAMFQLLSASQFYAIGRADPGLARAAVRRIIHMGTRVGRARLAAEAAFESGSAPMKHRLVGALSVELSWLEEELLESVKDWNEFHEGALRGLREDEMDARDGRSD
jgi:hypothetical protein